MKKYLKLMAFIMMFVFYTGTTVLAADMTYESIEGGDIDLDGDGDNDGESSGLEDEEDDDESTNIEGEEGDTLEDEESAAGGKTSPQTNASVTPIVVLTGVTAAYAAIRLKGKNK